MLVPAILMNREIGNESIDKDNDEISKQFTKQIPKTEEKLTFAQYEAYLDKLEAENKLNTRGLDLKEDFEKTSELIDDFKRQVKE